MDHFNQAPPDQQLDGYLKGDEKLRFQNLHPDSTDFSAQLPGRRVRLFVLDDDDKCREVPMNLDTLFIDLEEGALYLTWRGLTSAKQPDLADVKFGYIVDEDLDTDRVPAREYEESFRASRPIRSV